MLAYGLKRHEGFNKRYRDCQECKESGASSKFIKLKHKNRQAVRRYWKKCERQKSKTIILKVITAIPTTDV